MPTEDDRALWRKLGLTEGARLALLGAPDDVLDELPPGVVVTRRAGGRADVVVAFFDRRAALERRLGALERMIFPSGGLWIAWPKRTSGVATDLSDQVVRQAGLARRLVDNKVCAIDATWSGLRFVWRLEHRGGPPDVGTVRPPSQRSAGD